MQILVVGGSGRIGTRLVDRLHQDGHRVLSASRSSGVDAFTGDGLPEAVQQAEIVIDVSNPGPSAGVAATEFYLASGRNIAQAEIAAGVRHHIILSVVGVDRLRDSDYFRGKLMQEEITRQSGTPFTILRATQFFEFMPTIAEASAKGGAIRLPDVLVQPVAADDVSGALARIAESPPVNRIVELAGPELLRLGDVVTRILAAAHDRRPTIVDPETSYFGVRLDERTLIPGADAQIAPTHLDAWLDIRSLHTSG